MNLYLLSQSENTGYETYDSCVVAAESPEDAVRIHPGNNCIPAVPVKDPSEWELWYYDWANSPSTVSWKLIGTATPLTQVSVICASYNAG